MTPLEVLRGARTLIADPARWMRGNLARNRWDVVCDPRDPSAVRWCALGALVKVGGHVDGLKSPTCEAAAEFGKDNDCHSVTHVNDVFGYETVLRALDKTIARLETEELEAIPTGAPEPEEVLTPA